MRPLSAGLSSSSTPSIYTADITGMHMFIRAFLTKVASMVSATFSEKQCKV